MEGPTEAARDLDIFALLGEGQTLQDLLQEVLTLRTVNQQHRRRIKELKKELHTEHA